MGGSNKSPASASPAATPTPQQPTQTIQPAMPGQLEALAQQLSAGFGQSAPDMLAYIQQFHKPMQVPDYSALPAAPPAPATPASATTGGVKRGMGASAQPVDRMIFNRSRGGGS